MKALLSVNRRVETASQNAGSTRVADYTTEDVTRCPAPEQQPLVRRWHVGAMLTDMRQVIAQWRRRVLTRNKLTTLSDGDLRDIRRTRAEVEAVRCKAFWWA